MGLLEQQYAEGLLAKDPLTANPKMLAQALKARQQPRTQLTGQGLLDTAAIGLSPVPVIGDALGLAADASRFYNEPESRTPLNFGLAALGLFPMVPSMAGKMGKVKLPDWVSEVTSTGGKVNPDGTITVYHRTTPQAADEIRRTGLMRGKENGLFFSTVPNGQNTGYGDAVLEMKIPASSLELDDIFSNEAHLKLPTKRPGDSVSIKGWLK